VPKNTGYRGHLLQGGVEDQGRQDDAAEVEDDEDASLCQQVVVRVRGFKRRVLIRLFILNDDGQLPCILQKHEEDQHTTH